MACRKIVSHSVVVVAGSVLVACAAGGAARPSSGLGDEDTTGDGGADTSISTTITVGGTANVEDDGDSSTRGVVDDTGPTATSGDTTGGPGDSSSSGADSDGGSTATSGDTGSESTSTGDTMLTVDELGEGDLVITEVMYNPAFCTDANCEWIEIYNASGSSVDLLGLTIIDIGDSSGQIEESVVLGDGEYGVLAAGTGGAWGYSFDPLAHYGVGGPFFSQTDGDLVEVANATTTIDIMLYTADGDVNAGASLELDPAILDADLNDDETQWCVAQDNFGDGDFGSPGAANTTACQ